MQKGADRPHLPLQPRLLMPEMLWTCLSDVFGIVWLYIVYLFIVVYVFCVWLLVFLCCIVTGNTVGGVVYL